MPDGDYVVAGEQNDLTLLAPLLDARAGSNPARFVALDGEASPGRAWWRECLQGAASLLRLGEPKLGAQAALPAALIRARDGRLVPAAWLPRDRVRIAAFARRAAAALSERQDRAHGPVLLLGQRDERALALSDEIEGVLREGAAPVFRWTAERMVKHTLRRSLGIGAGAAIYVGHGYAWGWAGYSGFSSADIMAVERPLGAVLSLCCDTLCRTGWMSSFSDEIVLGGAGLAALGATSATLNARNRCLAQAVAGALCDRPRTIGELLGAVGKGAAGRLLAHYRLVGDPLAPLSGAPQAADRAALCPAPGPNEAPPPLPHALWYG